MDLCSLKKSALVSVLTFMKWYHIIGEFALPAITGIEKLTQSVNMPNYTEIFSGIKNP